MEIMVVTAYVAVAAVIAFVLGYLVASRIAARKHRVALADMESLGETLKQPLAYAESQLQELQQELQELQRRLEWSDQKLVASQRSQSEMLVAAGLEHAGIAGVADVVNQYRSGVNLLAQENEQLTGSVVALTNELTAVKQDRFEEVAKRLACEKKFAEQFQNHQQWLAQARKDNRQLMSGFQEIAAVMHVMSLSGVLPADVVWRGHEPVSGPMIAKSDEKFKQALEAAKTQTPEEDSGN